MPVNDKKRAYGAKLVEYIENYKSVFVVTCDNVGSKQMQQIRIALRGQAVVLMGKNVRCWRGSTVLPVLFCAVLKGRLSLRVTLPNLKMTSYSELWLITDNDPQGA